jgi:uncharacterized membrane protein YiaA
VKGIWTACATLTLVVVVAFPVFAWYGYSTNRWNGVWAAGVAAAICWVSALATLVIGAVFGCGTNAVKGVLLGMVFRMGVPFAAGIVLHQRGGELAEAGVFGMILGYYFVTLVVETVLAVRLTAPTNDKVNATEIS